jgi:tetratricopeptide (TPR) repeat protein
MKRRVLLHGNCQGAWLASVLNRTPEISAEHEIVYHANFGEIPANHPIHQPDFLQGCSCVLWQTASGFKPPEFLASLPAGCRQIRFPTLWLKLLWPTYTVDPRNKPEEGFPYGRHPYGDRLVLKLVNEGVPPDEVPRRYIETDLNKIINLDRFAEMCLAELRFNDQQSDIAVAPHIESAFRKVKLFGCINHPTLRIMDWLLQQVAGALLDSPALGNRAEPPNAADVIGSEEIPVHPQIIDHFKLEWAYPGMRWRYHSAFLTVEEFARALATFDAIPLGDSPQVWFGRAEQAFGRQEVCEAERLLREGSVMFPQHADFVQCLGVLLVGQNRFDEAARVYLNGIAHHPDSARLRNELGIAYFRQGRADQAVAAFQAALRIDPNHEDARANLAIATQECDRVVPLDAPLTAGHAPYYAAPEISAAAPAP